MKTRMFFISVVLWAPTVFCLWVFESLDNDCLAIDEDTAVEAKDSDKQFATNEEEQVTSVVHLINKMPSWPILPIIKNSEIEKSAYEDARAIEDAVNKIATNNLVVLRKAYVQILASTPPWHSDERLFWLNRYLFDTPATVRRDSKHFVRLAGIGWNGPRYTRDYKSPKPLDAANIQWPWYEDANEHMRFKVGHIPFRYNGPPYPAIEVFDYCRENFRPRFNKVEALNIHSNTTTQPMKRDRDG